VAKDLQLDMPPGSRAPALTVVQVVSGAREPLRAFLDRHASLRERRFFQDASRRLLGAEAASATDDRDFLVLVPAFSVSQLTEAFLAGVLVMLPFLVIDLVVAHVLMALGMQMLSPAMVSLPVKLLLFVLLDGWSRLAHALVLGYR
jgi:type III secretion protein R